MLPIDWRSPTAYESIQNLDTVGFAWEFLRRNPNYHRDHHEITHTSSIDVKIAEERARRWGLCLPCRSYDRGT
jgi:Family of unknown function (DUF6499)